MTREDDFVLRSRAPIVDLDVTSRAVDTPTPPDPEWRALLREAIEVVHQTESIRRHSDPNDKTGWNVHGIETCADPLCVASLAALATPDPSIPERPEYQPAAATRLFANGGNLPSGSIPERPAEPLREALTTILALAEGEAPLLEHYRREIERVARAALAQQRTPEPRPHDDTQWLVCGVGGCDFAVERGEGRTMALHESEEHEGIGRDR